ncbi:hypothetical protein SCLARK_001721 [Spiroplasma clarkii]|uniref:Uncharacterized protein n=1 Tax=Spiroplasma clarkii TaxID=2139 RepID=A0A1Y0L3B9_9MOLU|nr:hypothetical protein [Spiroplasma clarkii]ARU92179.1 hypothetical protein SCLARK_001721 [Spiroplasma clarkii]ATX71509.1 hypothetical protein SCLAR_v1c12090 [Spiroplasma clarkii]
MSMSAEEILFNCQKQFNFIKTDIETLLEYIKELISHCQEIDNSKFYEEQLLKIKERVLNEINDLKSLEKSANEIKRETHVAVEKYHELQRMAEKKREAIAEFKTQIYNLKRDVVKKEQMAITKKLQEHLSLNYNDLKSEILNLQNSIDDKALVQKYLDSNEVKFINLTTSQIISKVNDYLVETKESIAYQAKEVVRQAIKLYEADEDLVKAIQTDAKEFLQNTNSENFSSATKQFLMNASKKAEQEAVRKDAVIKIVKAICEVGYIVIEENIRKIEEKNVILIHGEKVSGETASFIVRLDGSFVYNYEGFEGHEHDIDADSFLKKLHEQGVQSTAAFNKQYREPKYIAKRSEILKKKKSDSQK